MSADEGYQIHAHPLLITGKDRKDHLEYLVLQQGRYNLMSKSAEKNKAFPNQNGYLRRSRIQAGYEDAAEKCVLKHRKAQVYNGEKTRPAMRYTLSKIR
jgi:hypothetical protein